jgi:hypothetical protein
MVANAMMTLRFLILVLPDGPLWMDFGSAPLERGDRYPRVLLAGGDLPPVKAGSQSAEDEHRFDPVGCPVQYPQES